MAKTGVINLKISVVVLSVGATSYIRGASNSNTRAPTPQQKRGPKPKNKQNNGVASSSQQTSQDTMPANDQSWSTSQTGNICSTGSAIQLSSQPHPEPIPMNNWYGIGVFHQVEGGPIVDQIRASRARLLTKKKN